MKEKIVTIVKKYSLYVIGVALVLLLAFNCVNNSISELTGKSNVYEKMLERRVKTLKVKEADYKKIVDSLSKDNRKKDDSIAVLRKKSNTTIAKLAEKEKAKQAELNKVKSFTYKQSADYIAKTYNAPKAVSYTDTGVVLKDSIPNRVVETIVEKKALEIKVKDTESLLKDSKDENKILEGKVDNKDKALEEADKLSKEKDETLAVSKEFSDSMEKENRKLKKGRFIGKALIVVAFIGGILIAK